MCSTWHATATDQPTNQPTACGYYRSDTGRNCGESAAAGFNRYANEFGWYQLGTCPKTTTGTTTGQYYRRCHLADDGGLEELVSISFHSRQQKNERMSGFLADALDENETDSPTNQPAAEGQFGGPICTEPHTD